MLSFTNLEANFLQVCNRVLIGNVILHWMNREHRFAGPFPFSNIPKKCYLHIYIYIIDNKNLCIDDTVVYVQVTSHVWRRSKAS